MAAYLTKKAIVQLSSQVVPIEQVDNVIAQLQAIRSFIENLISVHTSGEIHAN